MSKTEEIFEIVEGITYIPKNSVLVKAETFDGKEYVICRTSSAGVFAGYLESRNGQEVILRKARRLWYWEGAASLSQLAVDGVSKPNKCRFPVEVDKVELLQAIEIIPCTQKAQESIKNVKVWEV